MGEVLICQSVFFVCYNTQNVDPHPEDDQSFHATDTKVKKIKIVVYKYLYRQKRLFCVFYVMKIDFLTQ
ncbi:MAG: hypothetical protein ABIJ59_07115 [Pseudomonadota bacterium]